MTDKQKASWTPERRQAQADRMRKLWEDPKFIALRIILGRKQIQRLRADKEWAEKSREQSRRRMEQHWNDPAFVFARSDWMLKLNQNSEFASKAVERGRKQMQKFHQDPAFVTANIERSTERIRRFNQDPEFQKKRARGLAKSPLLPERVALGTLILLPVEWTYQKVLVGVVSGARDFTLAGDRVVVEVDGVGGHGAFRNRMMRDALVTKAVQDSGRMIVRDEDPVVALMKGLWSAYRLVLYL